MSEIIIDASALLAMAFNEPGAEIVVAAVPQAVISAANLTEVLTRLIDGGATLDTALVRVAELEITTIPFDENLAADAAGLRKATRHLGLSLGDRACIALALARKATVLTADRAWSGLDLGVEIRCIR